MDYPTEPVLEGHVRTTLRRQQILVSDKALHYMAQNMSELLLRGEANEVKTIPRQSVVKVELGAERLRIQYVPPLVEELKPKIGFEMVPKWV